MTPRDPRALRNAFGTFMTGVTVVTAHHTDGTPLGFTANSFTSVSLEPPMVLVCLANTSRNYETLVKADGFAVNILSETQIDISNTFARPASDRFASINWQKGPFGSPLIEGVSAWFDCSMHKTIDAGDHVILIGEVKAFDSTMNAGLGYARGAYFTPSTMAAGLTHNTKLIVSALMERNGEVLLLDDGLGGLALPEAPAAQDGATATVKNLIAQTGLTAAPGFVYSVYEDADRHHQHISFLCHSGEGTPTKGRFTPLTFAALENVSELAMRSMLERFEQESTIGDFGIYYGSQNSGQVRKIT
ncbi:MAG: flavin reductase family protein [Roseobacter sp.]